MAIGGQNTAQGQQVYAYINREDVLNGNQVYIGFPGLNDRENGNTEERLLPNSTDHQVKDVVVTQNHVVVLTEHGEVREGFEERGMGSKATVHLCYFGANPSECGAGAATQAWDAVPIIGDAQNTSPVAAALAFDGANRIFVVGLNTDGYGEVYTCFLTDQFSCDALAQWENRTGTLVHHTIYDAGGGNQSSHPSI